MNRNGVSSRLAANPKVDSRYGSVEKSSQRSVSHIDVNSSSVQILEGETGLNLYNNDKKVHSSSIDLGT